jgi:LPS O-antigen subunit length determinant protein (WzzB/FepE family)
MNSLEESTPVDSLTSLLVRRRLWILASIVLTTVSLIAAAFIMTPVYRARTVLAPANDMVSGQMLESMMGQFGGIAALAGIGPGSDQRTREAMAVLVSRQFTGNFINERNLMPVLYSKKWDATAGRWKGSPTDVPSLPRAAELFDRQIRRAYIDKKSGMLILEIDWKNPRQAADWANDLANRVNAQMRARAIAEANASLSHLERQLVTSEEVELRAAINKLIEAQVKQRMLATVNPEYAFRVIDTATPPDVRDPIRPKKIAFALAGPLLGTLLGVLFVLAANFLRSIRRHDSSR